MAKQVATKKTAAAPPKSGAVATTANKNEVDNVVDITLLMRQDAGDGVSTAAEDNIVPLIYILQAQSKQCLKQKPEYIKGAEAGQIWPRGTKHLIDGENEGLPIIPVAFKKWWLEWGPEQGDGFKGRHEYKSLDEDLGRPSDASWVEDPKGGGKWIREGTGNVVVETREHAVLAYINGSWTGAVLSMSGSNHNASRTWMTLMKEKRVPKEPELRAPSYGYVYTAKTIAKSNDKGDWYGWVVEDGMGDGEVTLVPTIENGASIYRMAKQLAKDFKSGTKAAEAPVEQDSRSASSPVSDDDDI